MSMLAWIITTAIRAKHGYPLEDQWGGKTVLPRDPNGDATKALKAENEQLKATVDRLEERLKVLERIATDPSRQLADEIDRLR
jgi:cell division protein FtsB